MEHQLPDTAHTEPEPAAFRDVRSRRSSILMTTALFLLGVSLAAIVAAVAVYDWIPDAAQPGWAWVTVVTAVLSWVLAGFCWIGAVNTRPPITDGEERDRLDQQIAYLAARRAELDPTPPPALPGCAAAGVATDRHPLPGCPELVTVGIDNEASRR